MNIHYTTGDGSSLPLIEPLWRELNDMHRWLSPFPAGEYAARTFHDRELELMDKAGRGILKVFLAFAGDPGTLIGYCVCSVLDGIGEVDSLMVDESYRKHGVGDHLMGMSGDFFRSHGVKKMVLSVYAGNEAVMNFYERHGYHPRYIILEKKAD